MHESMLQVMQLDDVRFRKYVLQNRYTGIVVQNKRYWTVRGAVRQANRNVRRLNKIIRKHNSRKKV